MDRQVTLENIGKLIDTKLDAKIGPLEAKIDGFTETMVKKFEDVDKRFDRIEIRLERIETKVDTNHENRITRLEDSNRVIKTKLGLA